MPGRYRTTPRGYRGEQIDLETARAAIAQVAAERDALAQQLSRAQGAIHSLERQVDARRAEAGNLAQAYRALEARQTSSDDGLVDQLRRRLEQVSADATLLRQRSEQAEAQIGQLRLDREEALAERDRERAHSQQLEASLAEVRQAAPDADRTQRLAADLANLRRHQTEAIQQGIRRETSRLLVEVVSIRDTVERAVAASPESSGPFHDGMLAILSKVDAVFTREGAELLGAVGERFDPAVHEAVGKVEGGEPDTVHAVVSSGLLVDGGVVAVPAQVVVSTGVRR